LTFDAHPRSSLIVALDFDSLSSAMKFAQKVSDLVGMFKIGNQLFTSAGPEAVKQIATLGNGIFLDLKFHDIPNTVAGAVLSSAAMPGVQLVNVHALGGSAMLKAAAQAVSAGVDGVVASVQEAKAIRKACGRDFLIVTPGVRPAQKSGEAKKDDQARTATPAQAIKAEADYIVVGRPIIAADDPRAAAQAIVEEIGNAK
jgi:orotidine-5'-phosphate decarboxylase